MLPGSFRQTEGTEYKAPRLYSASKIGKSTVLLDVIRKEQTTRFQKLDREAHFQHHVHIGVIAIVQKYVDRAFVVQDLREQRFRRAKQ
jgi:hypothetical protein